MTPSIALVVSQPLPLSLADVCSEIRRECAGRSDVHRRGVLVDWARALAAGREPEALLVRIDPDLRARWERACVEIARVEAEQEERELAEAVVEAGLVSPADVADLAAERPGPLAPVIPLRGRAARGVAGAGGQAGGTPRYRRYRAESGLPSGARCSQGCGYCGACT